MWTTLLAEPHTRSWRRSAGQRNMTILYHLFLPLSPCLLFHSCDDSKQDNVRMNAWQHERLELGLGHTAIDWSETFSPDRNKRNICWWRGTCWPRSHTEAQRAQHLFLPRASGVKYWERLFSKNKVSSIKINYDSSTRQTRVSYYFKTEWRQSWTKLMKVWPFQLLLYICFMNEASFK